MEQEYARQMLARPIRHRPKDPDAPLVIAGLFSTANGIGEAARSTYRALEAVGLNPIAVDLSHYMAPVDLESDIPCQEMPSAKTGTLILQLNGPEVLAAIQHLGLTYDRDWYIIGYWAWELSCFPVGWEASLKYLSELWTISHFSASALSQHPKAPDVQTIHHALAIPDTIKRDRKQFGWQEDEIVFLTLADSMSSFQRKNPFSAIDAFVRATNGRKNCRLVIKTRNIDRDPEASADLRDAVKKHEHITLMDESLSDQKRWELLEACDVLISMHRSEGFGLVLAETMGLGKPVVATAWSGNLDFMTEETAFLVQSKLIKCQDKYGVYKDLDTTWADPDIADASKQIQLILNNKAERERRANAAKAYIRNNLSNDAIGTIMKDRLITTLESE